MVGSEKQPSVRESQVINTQEQLSLLIVIAVQRCGKYPGMITNIIIYQKNKGSAVVYTLIINCLMGN